MNKEILDTLDDLSKKPTTELAMQLMEIVADNMVKDKELERYKNIIDEIERYFIDMFNRTQDTKYLDDLQKLKELKGSDSNE